MHDPEGSFASRSRPSLCGLELVVAREVGNLDLRATGAQRSVLSAEQERPIPRLLSLCPVCSAAPAPSVQLQRSVSEPGLSIDVPKASAS